MNFLADEGVDSSVVTGLRKSGHNVYFVIEEERAREDDVLLEKAKNENRILITRDKDFGELVYRLNKAHAGVILIRLEGLNTIERGEMVCKLISQHHHQLQNFFSVIQRGVIRIR